MTILGVLATVIGFGAALLIVVGMAPAVLQQATLAGWCVLGGIGLILMMLGRRPSN